MFDAALETYVEIPSDTLSFDERPWMKAAEITDALIAELATGQYHQRASTSRTATWSATPETAKPR